MLAPSVATTLFGRDVLDLEVRMAWMPTVAALFELDIASIQVHCVIDRGPNEAESGNGHKPR